jgi:hypothetical protein
LKEKRQNGVAGREVIMKGPADSINAMDLTYVRWEVSGRFSAERDIL